MLEDASARLRAAGCVFAEEEAELLLSDATDEAHLAAMVERRAGGLPLEHVLGWTELAGVRVAVDPGVFVPRVRSELLVAEALRRTRSGAVVIDLCCGSGALGLVVARRIAGVELHATDIDPGAVACARRNLDGIGMVHRGDLFAALPRRLRGRVDVIVANTPYVPTDEVPLLPREAREHEPMVALDGGRDGLDVQRRVLAACRSWLRPGGVLIVEVAAHQAPAACEEFVARSLVPEVVTNDELEATIVIGVHR